MGPQRGGDGTSRTEHGPAPGRESGLGRALAAAGAATVLPGCGHLLVRRRGTGTAILAAFLLVLGAAVVLALTGGRSRLLGYALNTGVLRGVAVGCVVLALLWIAVIVHTYALARPRRAGPGLRFVGATVVVVLCAAVAAPLGFAANLAEAQRRVVEALFPTGGASGRGNSGGVALPARLNVLLFGSDAGSDRTGTRSDSMMVASIDSTTSQAVLFGLPRNIERAPFPAGSAMAARFPDGFHDPHAPLSGDYLLNAEYAYGSAHPELAPAQPTTDPGLNLLMSSVTQLLGIPIDYYLKIDMAGFATLVDAVGGVTIDVGPVPLPIGGVLPDGTHVPPQGYVPAGVQHLDGNQALWYARSRRNSDDYSRMSRQRCLIDTLLTQKSATDLLMHFQAVAMATTTSVSTNVPQSFLPPLAALVGDRQRLHVDSVTFDPSLPDPYQRDGRFNPSNPDFAYMRQIVAGAIVGSPITGAAPSAVTPAPSASASTGASTGATSTGAFTTATTSTQPVPLANSCAFPDRKS